MVLVAVVDAGEHLLHEDGRVLLRELAPRDDLVEEFAALANPTLSARNLTQSRCSSASRPRRTRTSSRCWGGPKTGQNSGQALIKIRPVI